MLHPATRAGVRVLAGDYRKGDIRRTATRRSARRLTLLLHAR